MAKTARVRKDAIVSTTMTYNTRVLLDTLADARGMSRSEYIRFLVVTDAQEQTPRVVAAAAAELINTQRGRPTLTETLTDSFLINETKAEYGRCLREFGMFIGQDPVGNALFTKIMNEPCIVMNETAYNYDDFQQLSREDREDIIAAKLQQLQDQELADEDEAIRNA